MKRIFAAVLLLLLAAPAWGQDFEKAMEAYDRGDYAAALEELRVLAEQGHVLAQRKLGIIYATSFGVPRNFAEAVKWYRKAADQGNADAQLMLGVRYEHGDGVPRDHAQAVKWYRKAAEQGHAEAQTHLGAKYAAGQGVSQDLREAAMWYAKAADQGYARAQALLAFMYVEGQAVPKDYVLAYKWLNLAAFEFRTIDPVMYRKLTIMFRDMIETVMTPDQIAEAQRLVREWKPKKEPPVSEAASQ